jgi:hypothetical protein
MAQANILWVQDEYDGPMNGLVEYNGEKLWFSRLNTPSIISSTEIPVPYLNTDETTENTDVERTYLLHRLSGDDLILVTENHLAYCEETGAPVNHGDPFVIRSRPKAVRMDVEVAKSLIPEGKEVLETTKRPLGHIKRYDHKIIPGTIKGEFVTVIKESQFKNYLIPRTFQRIEV